MRLYLTRLHDSRHSSKRKPKEVPVELTTLDKVYQASKHMFEDKRVIMKVDVEGAALRVVRGGLTMIEERRPYVILEVHRGEGEDDELAAMPYLLKLGYRWRLLERRDTHFPHFMIALEPS
ncbi:MAG: FkbM family methyltransferase [Acidilobaceae archaeon]